MEAENIVHSDSMSPSASTEVQQNTARVQIGKEAVVPPDHAPPVGKNMADPRRNWWQVPQNMHDLMRQEESQPGPSSRPQGARPLMPAQDQFMPWLNRLTPSPPYRPPPPQWNPFKPWQQPLEPSTSWQPGPVMEQPPPVPKNEPQGVPFSPTFPDPLPTPQGFESIPVIPQAPLSPPPVAPLPSAPPPLPSTQQPTARSARRCLTFHEVGNLSRLQYSRLRNTLNMEDRLLLTTVLNKKKAAFRSRDREARKAAQQEVKHCVKEAKDSCRRKVEQKLRENNMREVWEGVRTITGLNTKTRAVGGTMERANKLNDFFNRFTYQPGVGVVWRMPSSTCSIEPTPIWIRESGTVRILFLDFSSAFNTIQPTLLRDKLSRMGVDPQLMDWISDYLTGRPQYVGLKDITCLTRWSAALEPPRAQCWPLFSSPCTPQTSATTRSCVIFRILRHQASQTVSSSFNSTALDLGGILKTGNNGTKEMTDSQKRNKLNLCRYYVCRILEILQVHQGQMQLQTVVQYSREHRNNDGVVAPSAGYYTLLSNPLTIGIRDPRRRPPARPRAVLVDGSSGLLVASMAGGHRGGEGPRVPPGPARQWQGQAPVCPSCPPARSPCECSCLPSGLGGGSSHSVAGLPIQT
ncbi:hypothetical protein L3Q82_005910 [Scortum barcoo]|uniref:Uncharacterized protein n=1 Tax=Scortum barcoo TaxID=214431 RepID=A0ACB8V722_9TELE|nr:hypothetical protein L3Q82_005910 [Scortum barcoo]